VTCAALDECHAIGQCQPSTGTCTTPPKICPGGTTCHLVGSMGTCCTDACTQGTQRCGGAGGLQTCVTSDSCTSWSGEVSCPRPPVNGIANCSGDKCEVTCNTDSIKCIDNQPRCDLAKDDFESGLNGWDLVTGGYLLAGKAIASSGIQPHSGSHSAAVTVQTDSIQVEWRLAKPLCSPAFVDDLRGKRISAWFYWSGPAMAPGCCGCLVRFIGRGPMSSLFGTWITNTSTPALDENGDAQDNQLTRLFPVAGQWMQFQGYFPRNIPYTNVWMTSPITMEIDCGMGGASQFTWGGTVYLDDINIQ
jgi:hypothetical protein